MPALTKLRLKDSIPDDSGGPSTYPDVNLPFLQVLDISSGVGPLMVVLHHISIPHSAILKLICKGKHSMEINFSNFLSVLSTRFLSSLVFRSLTLRGFEHCFEFYFWTTATNQDSLPFSQPQLELILTWPPLPSPLLSPHDHVKALTCAFDAMSLPFLTQLQISTFDYIDSQTWVDTFGMLPLLERVCMHSYATQSFLEALVYRTKATKESKTAYCNVSFPKLRYIYLKGTNFNTRNLDNVSVDMLLDCLMERCERNTEAQVLHLDSDDFCTILSVDIARLKEVVDVIWDKEDLKRKNLDIL